MISIIRFNSSSRENNFECTSLGDAFTAVYIKESELFHLQPTHADDFIITDEELKRKKIELDKTQPEKWFPDENNSDILRQNKDKKQTFYCFTKYNYNRKIRFLAI